MDITTLLLTTVPMILLVFIPGLLLSMAVFPPERKSIDNIERAGVSLVLGLMPQFLLYFADKNLFIPINTMTSYMSILLVSVVGLAVWFYRRNK